MGIIIETNQGARNIQRELPMTADAALEAVRSLDGGPTSTLTFERDDDCQMAVGGGPDRFYVEYADAQGGSYNLVLDPDAKGIEGHNLGGDWTELPTFAWVCREAAEKAAVEFAETGRIKLTPEWLNDQEFRRLEEANEGNGR